MLRFIGEDFSFMKKKSEENPEIIEFCYDVPANVSRDMQAMIVWKQELERAMTDGGCSRDDLRATIAWVTRWSEAKLDEMKEPLGSAI